MWNVKLGGGMKVREMERETERERERKEREREMNILILRAIPKTFQILLAAQFIWAHL